MVLYSLTICANKHKCLFGKINCGEMILSDLGQMIKNIWEEIPENYEGINVDVFQIMPNHMHGIIQIVGAGSHACPEKLSLSDIVHRFKSFSTKQMNLINKTIGVRLWQRNFYEHIIRNEKECNRIREYISINPEKAEDDEYYMGEYG